MTFRVHVSFKATVLDPQGQTVCSALQGLGHRTVVGVRQGKFFDLEIAPGTDPAKAAAEVEQIAREVLTNPVIEEYSVEALQTVA